MLVAAGCGDDESSTGGGGQQAAGSQSQGLGPKPEVEPASDPPKEVEVEDLVVGSGPGAARSNRIGIRFVSVNQDGDEVYDNWTESEPPLRWGLGEAPYGAAFDKGLTGMKLGGRREVRIPAGQAYQEPGPLYYVVELEELKPASSYGGASQGGGASPAR